MKITQALGASALLAGLANMTTTQAASLEVDFQATLSSQSNANCNGEGRYYHVSLVSPNPGTGSFCANLPGTNDPAPPFVRNYDGPVEFYKFAGNTNSDITGVSKSSGASADAITLTTDDTAFDAFGQNLTKLWDSTDPGPDLKVGELLSASSDTQAVGWRDLGGAVVTVDVSTVPGGAGSVHFYYANYNGKPTVTVTMRDGRARFFL
ncbi:hypothetical protein [Haloferula sp. A504]|uniref:hypothetical protein n=1 Tax=Haloferula sp. A504 TaxID=3373601 RepID=UPI0031C69F3D|nr:hypothetical protein [Verrucomicrobiaceae bacterium E54]